MPSDIVKTFKIPLDQGDVAYFRARFREAKRDAASSDPKQILDSVRQMIGRVRSQKKIPSYLQEAVATAIEQRLGWQVGPTGSAKIELRIDEELISSSGRDERGIASRWTIVCRGQTLFTSRHGNTTGTWSGTGHSSGLQDEATALQQAARSAADLIAVWLEDQAERWPANGR